MEKVYHKPTNSIVDLTTELKKEIKEKGSINEYAKILALPENFSPQQLQMIIDGKLKDKVLVECETRVLRSDLGAIFEGPNGLEYLNDTIIKLNPHITIYNLENRCPHCGKLI